MVNHEDIQFQLSPDDEQRLSEIEMTQTHKNTTITTSTTTEHGIQMVKTHTSVTTTTQDGVNKQETNEEEEVVSLSEFSSKFIGLFLRGTSLI